MKARTRPAYNISGLPSDDLAEISRLSLDTARNWKGVGCDYLLEPLPQFNKAPCEKVLSGENNTYIVFGRDRNGPRYVNNLYDNGKKLGPYGPKGFTGCGTIDIVAGRFSSNPSSIEQVGNFSHPVTVDPDFFQDASRIYVSQKTDVDSNFKIGKKVENRLSEGGAAIAIKSDAVRLIAREGIKLVTQTDRKNSLGGNIYRTHGIELIAGNDDSSLQPMVKGENLVECVERLSKHVEALNGIVEAMLKHQMSFNESIMLHTHISPFYGLPTTPSETLITQGRNTSFNLLNDVQVGIYGNKINLANHRTNFLAREGKKFVCSRFKIG